MKIKLAIVGSRTFGDYHLLKKSIEKLYGEFEIEEIISGGARGADLLGARYARENKIPLKEHRPDWDKHGKSAGFIRNKLIIRDCTHCIVFWDGISHGAKHDIDLCKEMKKPCEVVYF